jgi:hypothetical protein
MTTGTILKKEEEQCLTCEWLKIEQQRRESGNKEQKSRERGSENDWCEMFETAPLGMCVGWVRMERRR